MAEDNLSLQDTLEMLRKENTRLKKEAEDTKWSMSKTNEGIKILYKELEKKNKALEQLDEMKSEFVSTVSHELRTPMTIIKESISQVVEGISGEINAEQKSLLAMALKNIERLSRIINNLLDIAKLEEGKVELHKEKFNLVQLAEEVHKSFEPHLKKKGLTLNIESSDPEIIVNADRDKIIQVFTNLIGNSVKFTEEGRIVLRVFKKEKAAECIVEDSGIGMAPEDTARVFNKFQQFGRKSGPGDKGTGLGLSITKGIIEVHKGHILVKSALGKGTKFIFTIPYAN